MHGVDLWPRVTRIFALECAYAYIKSEYLLNHQVLGLLCKVFTVVTAENYDGIKKRECRVHNSK